jgi:hypothetical protein
MAEHRFSPEERAELKEMAADLARDSTDER